jgi:histidinol phosphatase-like PHP family hydrolase
MRYQIDHDLHIHSYLSLCSSHGRQTPQKMLDYALAKGLSTIAITDHYWDEKVPGVSFTGPYICGPMIWYSMQNTARTDLALPLPQHDGVRFLYGCETEMDKSFRIGISDEEIKRRDFIIVPTTHLHMGGLALEKDQNSEKIRAELWVQRFAALMEKELPFHKIGVAHLTCSLFSPEKTPESTLKCLSLISTSDMKRLFAKAAKLGLGIELNVGAWELEEDALPETMRPYRIAAECGCKFYLGSDAHAPDELSVATPARVVELLGLEEEQKFKI